MEKQRCEQCGEEFQPVKNWQRFCTPQCRDAWHYHQYKLAEVQAAEDKRALSAAEVREVAGLRDKIDPMLVVEALTLAPMAKHCAEGDSRNARRRRWK